MVQPGEITCPKCGEDRETLITPVIDPMGKRFFCSVCAHEFRVPGVQVMKSALLVLVAVASLGCATMTERIVKEARQGLVWSADYTPRDGGNPEAIAALYEHLTKELRIDVEYLPADDPMLQRAFGISYHDDQGRFIRLRQDLSVNGTIEVLAHEASHLFQPPHLTRSQGDVFAEIVSAHVASRLGVPNAAATSALWLRQHKPSLRVALDLQREIAYVVKLLMPEGLKSWHRSGHP